jgi:hypothetical protein
MTTGAYAEVKCYSGLFEEYVDILFHRERKPN